MRPVSAVTATRYMSSVVIVSSLLPLYTWAASCLDRLGRTTRRPLGADMAPPQERDERERRSRQRNDRQQWNDNQPQNDEGQRVGERRRRAPCKATDHEREDGLREPVRGKGRPAQEVAAARLEAQWHRTEPGKRDPTEPAVGIAGKHQNCHEHDP